MGADGNAGLGNQSVVQPLHGAFHSLATYNWERDRASDNGYYMCQTGCCCCCCFCSLPHWAVMPRMLWQHTHNITAPRTETKTPSAICRYATMSIRTRTRSGTSTHSLPSTGSPVGHMWGETRVASVENKREKKLLTRFETRFLNGCLMPSQVCLTDWLTWRSVGLPGSGCYFPLPCCAQSQSQSQSQCQYPVC